MGNKEIHLTDEEIKKEGLLILDEIERVTRLLGLKYCLAYGTLLGAIRHNGYIPWDDDVDIWMMRKDFEVFIKEFNNHCSPDFKLLFFLDDENYHYFMPKVVSLRTCMKERWFKKQVKNLGVWVDVFILEYADKEKEDEQKEEVRSLLNSRYVSTFRSVCLFSKINNVIRAVKKKTVSDLFKRPSEFSRKMYLVAAENDASDYLFSIDGGKCCIYPLSDFQSLEYHRFEDRQYPVPSGYDDILTIEYGDYMTPPDLKSQNKAKHVSSATWRNNAEHS